MDAGDRDAVGRYLALMHRQRETIFSELAGISHEKLWQRPAAKEWCVGEVLDHVRAVNRTLLKGFRGAWWVLQPWARLRRRRPYEVQIDDVYQRPGFPMNVGWIWTPRYTPGHPATLEVLETNLLEMHQRFVAFYSGKDSVLLGHVNMYDPLVGVVNLIQALRVNVYHDELHFNQIRATLATIRA